MDICEGSKHSTDSLNVVLLFPIINYFVLFLFHRSISIQVHILVVNRILQYWVLWVSDSAFVSSNTSTGFLKLHEVLSDCFKKMWHASIVIQSAGSCRY